LVDPAQLFVTPVYMTDLRAQHLMAEFLLELMTGRLPGDREPYGSRRSP
jgi:hypothetical protein